MKRSKMNQKLGVLKKSAIKKSFEEELVYDKNKYEDKISEIDPSQEILENTNTNEQRNNCSRCAKSNCMICPFIKSSSTFKSTVTGKVYDIYHKYNCLSYNVIYLVTCDTCDIQYVGHTTQKLSQRFRDYCYRDSDGITKTMDNHFNDYKCYRNDIRIQIIDHVGVGENNRLEPKEMLWATELQTFKPKGFDPSLQLLFQKMFRGEMSWGKMSWGKMAMSLQK